MRSITRDTTSPIQRRDTWIAVAGFLLVVVVAGVLGPSWVWYLLLMPLVVGAVLIGALLLGKRRTRS